MRGRSRVAPIEDENQHYWKDGFLLQASLGVRRRLQGIVHLAVEGGVQMENFELYDEEGERVAHTVSDYAPWVRLAIETFIDPSSPR